MGGVVAVVFASLFADQVVSAVIVCPGMATTPHESDFYRDLSASEEVRAETVRKYLIPETADEMKFFLGASVKNKKLLSLPENHLLAYLEKRKQQNQAFWHMWNILCVKVKRVLTFAVAGLSHLFHLKGILCEYLMNLANERKLIAAPFISLFQMKDPEVNLCNVHMTSIQCPTLVVWGDSDELVHPYGAEILGKGITAICKLDR